MPLPKFSAPRRRAKNALHYGYSSASYGYSSYGYGYSSYDYGNDYSDAYGYSYDYSADYSYMASYSSGVCQALQNARTSLIFASGLAAITLKYGGAEVPYLGAIALGTLGVSLAAYAATSYFYYKGCS